MSVIEVSELRETCGGRSVGDGVYPAPFEEGEIFGLLAERRRQDHRRRVRRGAAGSPTGAGSGSPGVDPVADHAHRDRVLGAQLQESELQAKLTVREALEARRLCSTGASTGGRWPNVSASPRG
ncbi:hypothetical protein SALBM311S_07325 [Streptomyces alboniger]